MREIVDAAKKIAIDIRKLNFFSFVFQDYIKLFELT